jgi:NADH dehydrogenase
MLPVLEARKVRVLVLGAGYAGVLATVRMAKKLGSRAEVTLVNDKPDFVERIRLHQVAVGQKPVVRSVERMLRGTGATLLLGRVTRIDPATKLVTLATTGGPLELGFDYLLYALGSGTTAPPIEGLAEHAYQIASESGALRVAERLRSLPPAGRVTVVGAGLTGIELATEIAESRPDLRVALITGGSLGEGLSAAGADAVSAALAALGVELREQTRLARVSRLSIETSRGEVVPSDVTVWCGGFTPNPIAVHSGMPTTREGRLAVDPYLRSFGAPEIFGAGDGVAIAAAEAAHIRMGCVTAFPLGATAADNIVRTIEGRSLTPFGFGFYAQCISLGRKRGLIQRVTSDDRPIERVITGRLGARVKEAVCKFTIAALAMERMFAGTYSWPRKGQPLVPGSTPAALPATIG